MFDKITNYYFKKKFKTMSKLKSSKQRPLNLKKKTDFNFLLNDVALEEPGYKFIALFLFLANKINTVLYSFLEKDEENEKITQHDIIENVDLFSAQKYFELNLDKFGPYRLNYTRNGRHLLIGGSLGHVAAFDWQTKKLHCEINVMEHVNDIKLVILEFKVLDIH